MDAAPLPSCLTLAHSCTQIRYVKGIDLSPGEIEEAKERLKQVKKKYGARPTRGISSALCYSR